MRVAMYYNNRDVRIEEMPRPQAGPGEVVIRVHASGICGSDVMEWYRVPRGPRVLGHEIAGEIVERGAGVRGFQVGDRVMATHHVPCGSCHFCTIGHPTVCDTLRATHFEPGGFAEYVRIPEMHVERGMLRLPEGMSYEEGSFVEPLGCVVRGQNLARVGQGQTVAVVGTGLAGLLHVQLARLRGAKVAGLDILPNRLAAARRLGASIALDSSSEAPAKLREWNEGRLADRVIVCTAAPAALDVAFALIERGGTILFFAPPPPETKMVVPLGEMWWDEITLMTSYAAAQAELREALELLRSRRIDGPAMVSHRLPLAEISLGFRLAAEARDALKVIIEPQK